MAEQFHFHVGKPESQSLRSVTDFHDPQRPPRVVRLFWPVFYATLLVILLLFFLVKMARASGPAYVAGASYFDSSVKGQPLVWAGGAVNYYTDPGDLGSLLPHATADAFVADAFSRWTLIPTAALAATQQGALAEDVSGSNVILNSDGTITMPADILPTATAKPVAIVYDADGAVTDALLGAGAGGSFYCASNSVSGGDDNLGTNAQFLHAMIVINGNCAQTSAQLPDLKYHLVRVLGRMLGLDWSQVNVNVVTWKPLPTAQDLAGFPVMHASDRVSCLPVSLCYPNADVPKMDDQAALSRLYPITNQNIGNFPGKQLFTANTTRIHGSVYFVDASGQPAQPMQGVNVVARWIDPTTGLPSRTYAAAAVSGFLFHGWAGNPVTGDLDGTGQPYDRFGSDDAAWEGFYDLAGLQIPNSTSGLYQLTVEALDPFWSQAIRPYGPWQVQPSGAAQPITVTVSNGGDVQQDVLMQGSSSPLPDAFDPATFAAPAPVPPSGEWIGSLSGYGESDFFRFTGKANRSLSVEVTALDETGAASESKALPMLGMWALADPPGAMPPASTLTTFQSQTFAMSQLDVNLWQTTDFRVGISDFRGDGRPDYRYHARLFYGDQVIPSRVSARGGTPLMLVGYGFRPGNTVQVAKNGASVMSTSPEQIMLMPPAAADGVQDLTVNDPVTGATSILTGVLTYGAGPTDILQLIAGTNTSTPVGGQAPNPVRVRVLAADGVTPVSGASVQFSAIPAASFDICGGAASCTVFSDDSGDVSAGVTVLSTGNTVVTAKLAPASYTTPQAVQTTILGTQSTLDLAMIFPYQFIAQGATVDVPLSVRVLSNGAPLAGKSVKFQIVAGTGSLTAATVASDTNGFSSTTLHVASIVNAVQVSACAEPGDAPCQTFYGTVVPTSQLKVEPVSGNVQLVSVGQAFAPIVVRATDSASPPNAVQGASVVFQSMVMRADNDVPVEQTGGDILITSPSTPVILSSSQSVVLSGGNGLASLQATTGLQFPAEVEGTAVLGSTALPFELEAVGAGSSGSRAKPLRTGAGRRPRTED
jgi:hypothetical protein